MWNDSSEFFAHHYNNTSTVDKLFVIRNQGFIIIPILNVPLDDLVVKRFSDISYKIYNKRTSWIYHSYNNQAATDVASRKS